MFSTRLFAVPLFFVSTMALAEPNVGMVTVDELFRKGECQAAIDVAYPHAQNGEPWAQYRVGAIYVDEKCHFNKVSDALSWFKAAALYESKTAWERGSQLSLFGPTGFFNARAASMKAALNLAYIFQSGNNLEECWYWVNRAMSQYSETESEHANLERILKKFEANIPEERLAALRACGTAISCIKAKIPDPPLKPLTTNTSEQ